MKSPRKQYEAALADFSQPGNRWRNIPRLTYWGKVAGLTKDDIISDAKAVGVHNRDADIRRGWNSAQPKLCHSHDGCRHSATITSPKQPPTFPLYVRNIVAAGGCEATSADLLAMSPIPVPKDGKTQTEAFLRALWNNDDLLHIFRDDKPAKGEPDINLMTCRDWLNSIERGNPMPGDLIVPNVFSGAKADTTDGRKSYIAQSCLAHFPFILIEFDSLALKVQAAFWRGLLSTSQLATKVAAITYSGGKSLHGLIHVGCDTLAEWQTVCGQLRGLLAADPNHAFRTDEQAMRPRTGTRLPGVHRFSNGRLQPLLYINPAAVRPMLQA